MGSSSRSQSCAVRVLTLRFVELNCTFPLVCKFAGDVTLVGTPTSGTFELGLLWDGLRPHIFVDTVAYGCGLKKMPVTP